MRNGHVRNAHVCNARTATGVDAGRGRGLRDGLRKGDGAMRLVTYSFRGWRRVGALLGEDGLVDLARAHAAVLRERGVDAAAGRGAALVPADMVGLLARGDDGLEAARQAVARVAQGPADRWVKEGVLFAVAGDGIRLEPPVPNPGKIVCLGINYAEHAGEAGRDVPKLPELFPKFASALIAHGDPIRLPPFSDQIDYEGELALVIGRPGRYIDAGHALAHIAGYSVAHDVSARDYQFLGSQWLAGKAIDGFLPMGPWLVTHDEVPDPQALRLTTELNGEVMQDANTRDMVCGIPETIAYISRLLTLEPGDVILTGTPSGVGFARKPPRFLRPGDTVRITVEKVGTLENPVTADR